MLEINFEVILVCRQTGLYFSIYKQCDDVVHERFPHRAHPVHSPEQHEFLLFPALKREFAESIQFFSTKALPRV